MTECKHTNKGRLNGPFAEGDHTHRFVCKDCLFHLGWGKDDVKQTAQINVSLTSEERMPLSELVPALSDKSLNDFEKSFVESMQERISKYGDDVRLSEKQQNILDRMQVKYVGKADTASAIAKRNTKKVEQPFDIDADLPF